MIPAKEPIPELDERTESQSEPLAIVEQRRVQNLVKLLIIMLLTYILIFM